MAGADAAASLSSSVAPAANLSLISAFLACAIAQFLKPFTTWLKDKKWDSRRMLGSGGMPSSHSATVTALATAIGFQDGAGASSFAIAVVLACVLLNQIVCELPPEHPVANVRPLRDSLGHTPFQVAAGALLGVAVAVLLRSSTYSY
ncbi:hypothetical protein ACJIZ3_006970 [Penstemon smallii]|uniref:Acid phosphatase/vanadium-dependent haloperoxidase-related protein n=1 Tax=Penstemon smallii TaxID=265156 RepID=A0ABD3S9H7_9LAMI